MSALAAKPHKKRRWMDWKPQAQIIENPVEGTPSEPTKPGSVGFVSSTRGVFPIIGDEPSGEPRDWPAKSLEAEQRCGQPHAKLFPFIGRKVRTPGGPGTLLQVFADRVTVVLDSEVLTCSFYAPGEIEPINWEAK